MAVTQSSPEKSAEADKSYIEVRNFYPSFGNATGLLLVSKHVVFILDDGARLAVVGQSTVPTGKTGIKSISVRFEGQGSAGNWYFKFNVEHFLVSGDTQVDTGTYATYPDVTSGREGIMVVPDAAYNALTGIVAGSIICVEVDRDGADVSDSTTSNFRLMGVEIAWL